MRVRQMPPKKESRKNGWLEMQVSFKLYNKCEKETNALVLYKKLKEKVKLHKINKGGSVFCVLRPVATIHFIMCVLYNMMALKKIKKNKKKATARKRVRALASVTQHAMRSTLS